MLLLSTDSLQGYGLNRIFQFAKETGFDGIELTLDPDDFDTLDAAYIAQVARDADFPVIIVRISTKKFASEKKIRPGIELAVSIGAKRIVLTAPRKSSRGVLSFIRNEAAELREKLGMSICLRNPRGDLIFGFLPQDSMNNMKDLKEFGEVCLDTSYLMKKRVNPLQAVEELGEALKVIHFSDAKGESIHLLPSNEGEVPLESLFQKLKKKGFPGDFVLTVSPESLEVQDREKMIAHLRSMKAFYENNFLKKSEAASLPPDGTKP